MRYELRNRMKKNFQCFVVLFIISSVECKNRFPRKEKNEIYFTLEKVVQPNGSPKIKLVLPQSTTKENKNSKEANNFILGDALAEYDTEREREDALINYYLGLDLVRLNADSKLVNNNKLVESYYDNDKENQKYNTRENDRKLFRGRNNLRFKKEIIDGGFSAYSPHEYRYQDALTGSYSFGYRTYDQYREEMRTADGTVYGNFGWLDKAGKWHHTTFVADRNGYRTYSPEHHVNNYPTSDNLYSSIKNHDTTDAPFQLVTQSSYESYSSPNTNRYSPINPYRVKGSTNGEQKKYSDGASTQYLPVDIEEPLLSNLKQQLNLIPPSIPNSYTMYREGIHKKNPSYGSYLKDRPSLTVHSSIKNIHSPLKRRPQKPISLPTKVPNLFKPTTQETVTATNLQDNFFNRLPLKPVEDVSPKLDKPLKQYSNYLTKWPDTSWPENAEDILTPLLRSLGSLTGRSNTFADEEILERASTDDKSKRAKSVYDSAVKEPNSVNSNKRKRNPLYNNQNKEPVIYRLGNFNFENSVSLMNLLLQKNKKYNPFSALSMEGLTNDPDVEFLNPTGESVLFLPLIFNWEHNPFQFVNLPTPYWHQLLNPTFTQILFLYSLHGQTYPYSSLPSDLDNKKPLSSLIYSLKPTHLPDPQAHDDDDVDYILLSDEFKVINGSITNDPAFGSILDHLPHADSNNTFDFEDKKNFTFEINTKNDQDAPPFSNIDETFDSTEPFREDPKIPQVLVNTQDDIPKIPQVLVNNEDDTRKEIRFRLSKPLVRNSVPILLNKVYAEYK